MKLEREKNAKRNLVAGTIQRIVALALPFVLRTAIIYSLGGAYVGLNTLFGSVLSVLSLAELGFGVAVVYSMYDPIAKNDHTKICQLLSYYRKCYRIIGTVILGIGLVMTPFIPSLVKSDIPDDVNIKIVYIITLSSTALSYVTFAYKGSLLTALQRNDITSWVTTAITLLRDGIQIFIILQFRNYYAFILVNPLMTLLNGVMVELITRRKYPEYKPIGNLDQASTNIIKSKVKSLFLVKVGNVVFNSVDNIVISAFFGLTTLAIYGNYYYVISTLFGFLKIYYDSMRAGIGNKMALESKEKVYELYEQLFFLQTLLIGWMTICLICLYQDFIVLWLHEEKYLFDEKMVFLLAFYFYSWKIHDIASIFKEAAGLWEYDRFAPLISSMCNLLINIVLVHVIGIYGVVISTIACSLFFPICWQIRVLYKYYFGIPYKPYLKSIGLHAILTCFLGSITYYICKHIQIHPILISFLIKFLVCCIIPLGAYNVFFHKNPLYIINKKRIIRLMKIQGRRNVNS
ncbi:MAG: polysaccharide biosynthesis protein [Clostridiales bacterium]|nr:polysaccharide biosynthesis protein [Clostridiales bacterium]